MKNRLYHIRERVLQAVIFALVTPLIFAFFITPIVVDAAAGIPQILSYQGRLTDSSGTLLGSASGTAYFFKFSIYNASSGGSKLWPSGAPASTSANVISGVFNVGIGDTASGYPDTLDFNFEDTDSAFLQVEVASTSNGTYEAISPRQRITASGYAINSKALRGFVPSQVASGSNVPVLSGGNLTLGGANPQINATSSNNLVIQGGAGTGDLILATNGGKVGIGTVSPSSTLHVVGDVIVTATTTIRGKLVDASGNAYVTSTTAGSGTISTTTAVGVSYFPTWGSANALTGTSTLYASGTRIGLGTTAPSSTLHVIGDFQVSGTSTISGNLLDTAGNKYTTTTANGITGAISFVGANGISISSSSQTITITDLASSTWLKVANNLSDLNNTSTARTNLGLGSAATLASTTWLVVANNGSDITSTSTFRTNLGLGDSATLASSTWLKVANNFSDLNNTSTARTNIGLGNVSNALQLVAANNLSDLTSTSSARTNLGLSDSVTLSSSTWLKTANNLSDLNNTSTARTNLGLGTAATQNIGAFLQTANNGSDITSTSTFRTNLGLGDSATLASSTWLKVANNLSDLNNTSTARTSLGLGDIATLASSTFLKTANNGSDINSTSTFRTNLGLGDSATLASSTWLKVANNLSDLNNTSTARTNLGLGDSATLASSTWLKVANNLSELNNTSTARTNLGLGNVANSLQLIASNNLSDLTSTSTARTNIGLGSVANALQLVAANNLSDLTSTSSARSNLGLGDAATLASSTWLKVANNLSDLNSTSTARTNLGLGTAATQNVGAFLQIANNGSDITSTSTFRTNLGLGDSATLSSSTWLKVANNLSDLNNTSTARTNIGLGNVSNALQLIAANNLSDLVSTSSARTNLGLGDISTLSSSTFLKVANNLSDLNNTSTARTNLGLGSAATLASTTWLVTANNLSDLISTSSARINIGLGNLTNALQLVASNNLSDLTSTSTARTNLGLDDSATLASSTWLKVANNFSDLNNTSTARTNIGLGNVSNALQLIAANNLSDLVSTSSARTNLGLGSAATLASTTWLVVANNGSDITSTSTFRTNLGLGDSATLASSTWLKVANNLSDLNNTSTARTNLGVGTVANGGTGNTAYTAGSIIFASSTSLLGQDNANFFWDNTNHRLGLGTASPSTTLHVVGTLTVSATTTIQGRLVDASGNAYSTSTSGGSGTVSTSTAVTAGYVPVWAGASTLTGTSTIFSSSTRIGIGTISPSSTLHIAGDLTVTATSTFAANLLPGASATYDLGSTALLWRGLHVASGSLVVHADTTDTNKFTLDFTGTTGRIVSDAATPLRITTGSNTGFNIDTSGNVGIGVNGDAGNKLTVAGSARFAGTITASNTIVFESVSLGANNSGGPCGGTAVSTTNAPLPSGTATPTTNDIFYNQTRALHSRIASVTGCPGGDIKVTLTDAIAGQTTADVVFAYTPVANIGDTSGGFLNKIYAVNYLGLTSTLSGGFDVAEQYPSRDSSIEAGDVVTLDASEPLFIQKSSGSHDSKLIGVISTNPALTFGNNTQDIWRKVALAGRVPVKISLENGEIQYGDYLTSSATRPGYAMKMTESGTALGIALETVTGDAETVMMMVRTGYQYIAPLIAGAVTESLHGQLSSDTKIIVRAAQFGVNALGQAEVAPGDTRVDIAFSEPYEHLPIVTITPTTLASVRYAVTHTTVHGFAIEIDNAQSEAVGFNWHAFESAPQAKLTVSDGSSRFINIAVVNKPSSRPEVEPESVEVIPSNEEAAPQSPGELAGDASESSAHIEAPAPEEVVPPSEPASPEPSVAVPSVE